MWDAPAVETKAVDSTGESDAFVGSLAVFMGEGLGLDGAVRRANMETWNLSEEVIFRIVRWR